MKAGDVIAFGGDSLLSGIIKGITRSGVSHLAVVMKKSKSDGEGDLVSLVESTGIDDFTGVQVTRLSKRMEYHGEIWYMPLRQSLYDKFDDNDFREFLFEQVGKPFDVGQGFNAAADALDQLPGGLGYNKEDFSKFFCSELVAAALEASGVVGPINASEVTPIDLCRWDIFEEDYFQIKGEAKPVTRRNTGNPADWNY